MTEEIRIGVFVCDCGTNIAGVVNVPEVVEYAKTLKHVVMADEGKWSCSVDYLGRMQELIKEHRLNRVVIASCTPRTHEPLFKRTTKEAGVNPYLLEFVSIREQVSWVHMREPEVATDEGQGPHQDGHCQSGAARGRRGDPAARQDRLPGHRRRHRRHERRLERRGAGVQRRHRGKAAAARAVF